MSLRRVGGTLAVKANGVQFKAKGVFTINLGRPKRDDITGMDGVHGFKELPQPAMASGTITYDGTFDLDNILNLTDAVLTFELANNNTIVMKDAFFTADGNFTTEEGELEFEAKAESAEQVT